MNKTYRSIWNASLGSWVAAPETARHGSGKTSASVLVLATALLACNVVHADTTVTLSDQQISSTSYATTPSDNLILSISNGTATQSGDISGTGSLVKDGAGSVVLSGNNTHSGGTAINAGALQVNQESALGLAASGVTASASTLKLGLSGSQGTSFNRALTLQNNSQLNSAFGSNTWAGDITLENPDPNRNASASATADTGSTLNLTGKINAASSFRLETTGNVNVSSTTSNVGIFRSNSNAGTTSLHLNNANIQASTSDQNAAGLYSIFDIGQSQVLVTNSTIAGYQGINTNQRSAVTVQDSTINGVANGVFTQWGSRATLERVTVNAVNPGGAASGVDSLISSHTEIKDSTINATATGGSAIGVMVRYGTAQLEEKGGTATLSGSNSISAHRTDLTPATLGNTSAILLFPYTQGGGAVNVSGQLNIDTNGRAIYNRMGTITLTDASITGTGDSASILPMYLESSTSVMLLKGNTQGNNQWSWEGTGGTFDISAVQSTAPFILGSLRGQSTVMLGGHELAVGGGNIDTTFSGNLQEGGIAGGTGASLQKLGTGKLTLAGTSSYTAGTTVQDGALIAGSATGLPQNTRYTINGGTLDLGSWDLQTSNLSGTGGAIALNNQTLTANQATNSSFAGSIHGSGNLIKQAAGSLTLSGTNTYTGTTDIVQGMLQAGTANAFSNGSTHNVAAGAVMNLAGHNQTVAGLSNSGTVQLSAGSPGTVLKVTGPYTGNNGVIALSSVLGADGSTSDKLLLSGTAAVASGTTSLQVTNAGGLGAQTQGSGIEVVGTENGASLQPGSFTLAGGHVDAGAFEYRLVQNAQSAALQSSAAPTPPPAPTPRSIDPPPAPAPAPEPAPTPTPSPTPSPTPRSIDPPPAPQPAPAYRAEVPLLSALPAQLRQADMAMLGDMHKRMGDEITATGAEPAGSRRVWGRILRTDPTIRQQGTVSPESSGHMTGFQAGLDLYADKNLKAGLYVGQLEGDMSVHGFASGVQGKYVGFNNLRSRYMGVYGTWQDDSGLYADAVLQGADYRSDLHTAGNATQARTKGSGWLASLEVGKPFALNSQWQIEPQAQLIYRKLSIDDTALSLATVKTRADDDWTLRLGARIKGSFTTSAGVLQPYGRVNIYRASNTTDVASFITPAAVTDIKAQGGYTATELATGASLQINRRTSIYGEVGKLWAIGGNSRIKSGLQASVGVKVQW